MIAGLFATLSAMGGVWLLHHGLDYWAAGAFLLALDLLKGEGITLRIRRGK